MKKNANYIIFFLIGIGIIAVLVWYLSGSDANTNTNNNTNNNGGIWGFGQKAAPINSFTPYSQSYLLSLGILPANDGANAYMWVDKNNQTQYGSASTLVAMATGQ